MLDVFLYVLYCTKILSEVVRILIAVVFEALHRCFSGRLVDSQKGRLKPIIGSPIVQGVDGSQYDSVRRTLVGINFQRGWGL